MSKRLFINNQINNRLRMEYLIMVTEINVIYDDLCLIKIYAILSSIEDLLLSYLLT